MKIKKLENDDRIKVLVFDEEERDIINHSLAQIKRALKLEECLHEDLIIDFELGLGEYIQDFLEKQNYALYWPPLTEKNTTGFTKKIRTYFKTQRDLGKMRILCRNSLCDRAVYEC